VSAAVAAIYSISTIAQASREVPLLVTIDMSHPDAPICRVEATDIDCARVREELKAMGVPTSRDIHVRVDKYAKYEVVYSVLESLREAGYRDRVGFIADGP